MNRWHIICSSWCTYNSSVYLDSIWFGISNLWHVRATYHGNKRHTKGGISTGSSHRWWNPIICCLRFFFVRVGLAFLLRRLLILRLLTTANAPGWREPVARKQRQSYSVFLRRWIPRSKWGWWASRGVRRSSRLIRIIHDTNGLYSGGGWRRTLLCCAGRPSNRAAAKQSSDEQTTRQGSRKHMQDPNVTILFSLRGGKCSPHKLKKQHPAAQQPAAAVSRLCGRLAREWIG